MILVGILLQYLFIEILTWSGNYNGVSATTFINSYTMTTPYCIFALTITPTVPIPIVLMQTSSSILLTPHLSDYQHAYPTSTIYDMDHAIKGMSQIVQMNAPIGTHIFINLIVFQASAPFSFTITVTDFVTAQNFCTNPPAQSNPAQSPYCQSCNGYGASGPFCQTKDVYLTNSTQVIQSVSSGGYKSFTISGSSSVIKLFFVADQPNANIFIQFKQFSSQIAGLMNFADNGNGARFKTNAAGQSYQIDITSGGNDVAIGLINQSTNQMNFIIWYSITQTVNILVIVLGVLGGLLFIALVIAAYFIIRRLRSPQVNVNPRPSASSLNQQITQNMLSGEQIQVYFPSVSCQAIFSPLQLSSTNLNSIQIKNDIDRDCVICLCPVDAKDVMKLTYCRHLFHSHCLVEWFKKQRVNHDQFKNCPYCRQQYSKTSTIQHFQQLLRASGKDTLAGVQLVQQIMKNKHHKSNLIIEEMKD